MGGILPGDAANCNKFASEILATDHDKVDHQQKADRDSNALANGPRLPGEIAPKNPPAKIFEILSLPIPPMPITLVKYPTKTPPDSRSGSLRMRQLSIQIAGDGSQIAQPWFAKAAAPALMPCPMACLPAASQQVFASEVYRLAYERAMSMARPSIYQHACADSPN
jgi:hypothetical protein